MDMAPVLNANMDSVILKTIFFSLKSLVLAVLSKILKMYILNSKAAPEHITKSVVSIDDEFKIVYQHFRK